MTGVGVTAWESGSGSESSVVAIVSISAVSKLIYSKEKTIVATAVVLFPGLLSRPHENLYVYPQIVHLYLILLDWCGSSGIPLFGIVPPKFRYRYDVVPVSRGEVPLKVHSPSGVSPTKKLMSVHTWLRGHNLSCDRGV